MSFTTTAIRANLNHERQNYLPFGLPLGDFLWARSLPATVFWVFVDALLLNPDADVRFDSTYPFYTLISQ